MDEPRIWSDMSRDDLALVNEALRKRNNRIISALKEIAEYEPIGGDQYIMFPAILQSIARSAFKLEVEDSTDDHLFPTANRPSR